MSGSTKPGLIAVILSVLASAFGVQSQQNYQRDFNQASPLTYIIVGVVFVALFVVSLLLFVRWLVQ
ncbi:DUF2970 domain-containing protein [Alteromonas sp. ASW11-19]|uniref:DUF2970 domain-containing protein n=1 Tax=Alteromonas salexigens TaxID=2982530 RepID=A0ABT2VJZ6_9ALTE|nr:DUF2970 domain-containing protein [Alteromonas salexigens]MCU7553320.1 DUF2970 domain-containing protein [Alteromonas salexigens]